MKRRVRRTISKPLIIPRGFFEGQDLQNLQEWQRCYALIEMYLFIQALKIQICCARLVFNFSAYMQGW